MLEGKRVGQLSEREAKIYNELTALGRAFIDKRSQTIVIF